MTARRRSAPNAAMLALLVLVFSNAFMTPARATVQAGDPAPDFTKDELGAPAPAARSLGDYSGKVVILFLLGYS